MTQAKDIGGIYVANLTPFDAQDKINQRAYLGHAEWLAQNGVEGIVPFGSNGEGASLTAAEKSELLKTLFAAKLPLRIIPTVAESNLPAALATVKILNDSPAAAIMV